MFLLTLTKTGWNEAAVLSSLDVDSLNRGPTGGKMRGIKLVQVTPVFAEYDSGTAIQR